VELGFSHSEAVLITPVSKKTCIGALMLSLVLAEIPMLSAEIKRISKIELAQGLTEPPGLVALRLHRVTGMAFSPDGQEIAVTFGIHTPSRGAPVTHLTVFRVASSEVLFTTLIPSATGGEVFWAPDGQHILVQALDTSIIVHPNKNYSCEAEGSLRAGFVSNSEFVTANWTGLSSRLRLYDMECHKSLEIWPDRMSSLDTDPNTSRVALATEYGDIEVLRQPDWKPERLSTFRGSRGIVRFVNGGQNLCASPAPGIGAHDLQCWDANTGKQLSRWPVQNGGAQITAAATAAPLISFVEAKSSYNPFISHFETISFLRWVLWNSESGAVLGTLPIRTQNLSEERGLKYTPPWVTALEANGKFWAIGGEGTVEIFAIEQTGH
jgi:dipeptidyl aminopeptidase/acylaminoacyl peptidase